MIYKNGVRDLVVEIIRDRNAELEKGIKAWRPAENKFVIYPIYKDAIHRLLIAA